MARDEQRPSRRPLLILASASPARLKTLQNAGFDPQVIVSEIDEDALLERLYAKSTAIREIPRLLAESKAKDVASNLDFGLALGEKFAITKETYVTACDTLLEVNGKLLGKPYTAENARQQLKDMRKSTCTLYTGQALIDANSSELVSQTLATKVEFADFTDEEIEAYIASREPLEVAGSFAIDALGAAFVRKITGDFHSVVGISIALLREQLIQLGAPAIYEFWL